MAALLDEFTLESVKDFMISRGGRVTNHQLVNQFKVYLTNPAGKEVARNKFKQYVNTLANISHEGGEKYLVLKRKFRVGTPLDESDYGTSANSVAGSHYGTPNQFNVHGSPQHVGPFTSTSPTSPPGPPLPARATPPYRAPPPYRPPPPATPPHQGYLPPDDVKFNERQYESPSQHYNGRQRGGSDPRYSGDLPMFLPGDPRYPPTSDPRYPPVSEPRFSEVRYPYDEPADLGIPPPPQAIRSSSSLSSLSSSLSPYAGSAPQSPAATYGGYSNPPPLAPLSASRPKSLSIHKISSPSEDSDSVSLSTTTVSSSSTPSYDEPPPPVPPRRRVADNKENMRPSPDGEEGTKTGVGDGCSEDGGNGDGEGGEERKISVSVREQTQKFNKMASESQLPSSSSRASSKSNRSSRSDKDDDDSTSILSYGAEGQEWQVATAKSDFNEILRLLKIHPTLARHKDTANGYTALHWAAKQGRSEVVKLLMGTHHVEVNAKSNGGYTPLHIAAMYNRTEVFDLLVHYGADLNMRDYSGKKPRTYNTIASTVSQDTQRRIVQRRNSVKEAAGFLRIGSLRKTTEAFNSLLSRDLDAKLHRPWGSSDSLPDADRESKSMPPPKFGPIKKRKTKKDRDFVVTRPVSAYSALSPSEDTSAQASSGPPINADSDSDSAYGFGSEWH